MSATVATTLSADHQRLGRLLSEARAGSEDCYRAFRAGLLRHISVEEKVLLPLLRAADHPFPGATQLRLDHAALVGMLVPPPTPELLTQISLLLTLHDPLEESADGLYALADTVLDIPAVLERIRATRPPPVVPNNADPRSLEAVRALLARAGRRLDP